MMNFTVSHNFIQAFFLHGCKHVELLVKVISEFKRKKNGKEPGTCNTQAISSNL